MTPEIGKKLNVKAWTSDEDKRLRELVISNASVFEIAADLGRTLLAVRARAHALRIALGRSQNVSVGDGGKGFR